MAEYVNFGTVDGMDIAQLLTTRPSARTRRRLFVGGAVLAVLAVFGAQQAPWARVSAGPTPDLSAAVSDEQPGQSSADPGLGVHGHLLATTVNASQLSWFAAVSCSLRECDMLPIETGDDQVQNLAAEQMAESERVAAQVARRIAGPTAEYPEAVLEADLGTIGGPSAGLMLTLSFLDALTAGDLTGGRTIAGTGTIADSGTVGPVAGAPQKVAGALAAGATVFFSPAAEAPQVRASAPEGMEVVVVDTAEDAVRWLCAHGGSSSVC